MVRIYTLTLAPSLDSATITPQIYPEGKLRCTAPVFEPGGGGINVARAIAHLGGSATAIFPAGGATGEHLVSLLADENVPVATVEAKDWTRQNLHVHVEASGEQYRFVMPGAALNEDEFRQLEEQVLEIESGAILVISGSLPPGVKLEKLTQLHSPQLRQNEPSLQERHFLPVSVSSRRPCCHQRQRYSGFSPVVAPPEYSFHYQHPALLVDPGKRQPVWPCRY